MEFFIRGYGFLIVFIVFLEITFNVVVTRLFNVAHGSDGEIIAETLFAVTMGIVLCALGWKWKSPSRIAEEGIETRRWFPFTWNGHMVFWIKIEYCGLIMIVCRSVRGYLKLNT